MERKKREAISDAGRVLMPTTLSRAVAVQRGLCDF